MSRRRAVITGIGPITCIGTGVDRISGTESSRKRAVSTASQASIRACSTCDARAKFAIGMPKITFSPHRLKRLDRYAQFAVVSAKLALEDARIDYSREKPQDRVGVSFGTALGGVCKAEEQYIRYLKRARAASNPLLPSKSSVVRRIRTLQSNSAFAASARRIQTVAPVAQSRSAKHCVTFATTLQM